MNTRGALRRHLYRRLAAAVDGAILGGHRYRPRRSGFFCAGRRGVSGRRFWTAGRVPARQTPGAGHCQEFCGMVELSRRGLPIVLVIAGGLALAACTSVALPSPGSGAPTLGPIAAVKMKAAPVKGDAARFAFTKITGAPGDLLTVLSDSLNREAKTRKLNLVPEDDITATYKVKGYVSAVGGPSGTLLVYVFDVLDVRGVRIHRISGQQLGAAASSDPWGGITENTVKIAAQHAVDDLAAWVNAI
jgi:hypothetical protein